MSLWFDLRVNAEEPISRMVIQREAPLGTLSADDIGLYGVTVDGRYTGRLEHRYGDGAWELARKAVEHYTTGSCR